MNKLNLTIDVDRINLENENHIRNFSQKIKNLAQHCVNYINSIDDSFASTYNVEVPSVLAIPDEPL